MSAVILSFPRSAPEGVCMAFAPDGRRADSLSGSGRPHCVVSARKTADFLAAGGHLPPFTAAWCGQHLPLITAAMELLEADDAEFERRCSLMTDEEGRMIVGELAGQLQRLGAHIADVADALGLTAARIRDAFIAAPSSGPRC